MKNIVKLARPHHWVKNGFVLLPAFFGGGLFCPTTALQTLLAFFAFSFAASAIYCYNDIIDVDDDRRHSEKCHRPIASGAVSVTGGYALMLLMMLLSATACLLCGERAPMLGGVVGFYFLLEIAYCCFLKRIAIVDVCILSTGFVLRILAGSAATGIVASKWLVLLTFLLTLLLSFAKRRDDVLRYAATGIAPRHNTKRYNLTFVNQAITVTAGAALVCYILYTISPEVVRQTRFDYGYLTSIFVVLGLLRYMQLTSVDERSGDPTKVLLHDRFLQVVIALWLLSYSVIIYLL